MTFILLLLSVVLAAWSVGSALWLPGGFYGVVLCGVVLGLLFAKRRFNGWLLLMGGFLVGLALSFYQLTGLAEGVTRLDRLAEVCTRLFICWQALVGGGTSTDILPFSFFLLFISWSLGFVSSWFLFRKHNIWGALFPGGIAVAASLTSLTSSEQMVHLYLYLAVGFLLAARLFNLERQHEWNLRGIQRYPRGSKLGLHDAFLLAVAVVVVTSLLPVQPGRYAPMAAAFDRVSYPMRVLEEEFARLVGGLPIKEPYMGHFFGPTQAFGGATISEEAPVLMVEAPFPVYLRARSYDVYAHQGWSTSDTRLVSPEWTPEHGIEAEFQKLQEVEVSVTSLFWLRAGDPVYVGGDPIDMSIDYQLEVSQPARYRIAVVGSGLDPAVETENLPPDLQNTVGQLRELSDASGETLTEAEILSALPGDMQVVAWEYGGEGVGWVIVERRLSIPLDTVSVRTADPFAAGGSYRATVYVSTATEPDLRAAGTGYPGWVLDRYLQLPDTMPSRVVELAQALTRDAETPYEKAVAIRDYLRTLDYSLDIEAPSDGVDGVDYFLFELDKGYCQYFASAMAVLLRACGVPCRMAVGYGPGEVADVSLPHDIADLPWPDGIAGHVPSELQHGQKVLTVANRHSWCEVFFPGYGWILFEPTPSYPVVTLISPTTLLPGDVEEGIGALPGAGEDTGAFPGEADDSEAMTSRYVWPLGMLAGLAVLGAIVWLLWRRLLGQVAEPRVAYSRICHLAALSRLAPQASFTPHEYGRRLRAAMPDVSADLDTVVDTYVRACYGRCNLTRGDLSRVAEAWPQVRNGLLRRAMSGLLPRRFW